MIERKNIIAALLATCLLTLSPAALRAGVPTEQVRQTADRVLSVLQDSRLKSADKQKERRDQIRQIVANRFDFAEMAKRSLGSNWQKVNNDEQRQFVELFTELLEKSYVDQIESYDGEKIFRSEMAKRSLGSNWQKVNNDEQRQFVELFTELLEKSYVDQIESYDGEKIV